VLLNSHLTPHNLREGIRLPGDGFAWPHFSFWLPGFFIYYLMFGAFLIGSATWCGALCHRPLFMKNKNKKNIPIAQGQGEFPVL
jgi:hypothetical protein